jgi:hypothetical protein
MTYTPGADAPNDGIYWCTVCKLPERFESGQKLPECKNMCGRGRWELVQEAEPESDEAV